MCRCHHPQSLRLHKEVQVGLQNKVLRPSSSDSIVRLKHSSICDNICCWPVPRLCKISDFHLHQVPKLHSLQPLQPLQPLQHQVQVDLRLIGQIKQIWLASGCISGESKRCYGKCCVSENSQIFHILKPKA